MNRQVQLQESYLGVLSHTPTHTHTHTPHTHTHTHKYKAIIFFGRRVQNLQKVRIHKIIATYTSFNSATKYDTTDTPSLKKAKTGFKSGRLIEGIR